METKEFYINDDGIRLHAKLDFPSGEKSSFPLAIIIHGFTGHMEERHITAVAETFRECGCATLRAEMYGHGKSDGEFRRHTLLKWINNALAVIRYAKDLDIVTDLYLCGHSQGGLLTMLTGAIEQDVLKAIIPLSPAWMIPEEARSGQILGVSFDCDHIPRELKRPDGLSLDGDYIRVARMIRAEDAIRCFGKPVLIVHGTEDEAVPVSYAYKAADLYSHAELVIIEGDTHCYDRHLEQVTSAVRDFMLRQLSSS